MPPGAPPGMIRPTLGDRMTETWLTYSEAAELLKIKLDSVKRRARARRWPRRAGNNGLVQICIPEDALPDRRPDNPPDISNIIRPEDPPLTVLRERAEAAEREAAAQTARAEALADQIADLRTERERLLTIIEEQSRSVRSVSILDRLFGRR